jgi:hypothetical protein
MAKAFETVGKNANSSGNIHQLKTKIQISVQKIFVIGNNTLCCKYQESSHCPRGFDPRVKLLKVISAWQIPTICVLIEIIFIRNWRSNRQETLKYPMKKWEK